MCFRRSFCFLRWSCILSSVVDVSSSSVDEVSGVSCVFLEIVGHHVLVSVIGKRVFSGFLYSVILFVADLVSSPLRSSKFQRRYSNGVVGFCNEVVWRRLLGTGNLGCSSGFLSTDIGGGCPPILK